jgi:hypothetical protein
MVTLLFKMRNKKKTPRSADTRSSRGMGDRVLSEGRLRGALAFSPRRSRIGGGKGDFPDLYFP